MSRESRDRFREVVVGSPDRLDVACLLIAAEAAPDTDLDAFLARGDRALHRLAEAVPPDGRDDERLRRALDRFSGQSEDYHNLASSLLPQVLATGRGLPILLSVVWTETARRVGIPAYGVALPGHFVVGVGEPSTFRPDALDGDRVLVDPWSGGALLPYDRARDIVERSGHVFRREHLAPANSVDTIARILANIRVWAAHPLRAPTRLWAIDLSLALPGPPPSLLRDRGTALLEMGNIAMAQRWWEEYAEVVEESSPSEAQEARLAIRRAQALLN